jgi:predicted porin
LKFRLSALATALLGLSSAAGAQSASSSLQIYGTVSSAVTHKTDQTGGKNTNEMSNSLLANSLVGLRGSEDLGGGSSASFRLESRIGSNNGVSGTGDKFWDRQAWVGYSYSPAVTLTAGRQYHAATDRAIQSLDVYNLGGSSLHVTPLGFFGVNRFTATLDNRVDSSVKLRVRGPAGLTGAVSAGMNDGVGRSFSFDLAQVTPTYAVGVAAVRYQSPTVVPVSGDRPEHTAVIVGGNVLFGPVRLYLHVLGSQLDNVVAGVVREQKNSIVHVGANWQATDTLVLKAGAYLDKGTDINGVLGRDGDKSTLVVSSEYFLSKRTSLHLAAFSNRYTDGYRLDPVNIKALARDPAASSTQGVTAGIRHDF